MRGSVKIIVFIPVTLFSTPDSISVLDGQPVSICDLNWVLAAPLAVACTGLADHLLLHEQALEI